MKEEYVEYLSAMRKKYGKCQKCGKQMTHIRYTHTFRCDCGNQEWYEERYGDKVLQGRMKEQ